jgi:hypothetical protein
MKQPAAYQMLLRRISIQFTMTVMNCPLEYCIVGTGPNSRPKHSFPPPMGTDRAHLRHIPAAAFGGSSFWGPPGSQFGPSSLLARNGTDGWVRKAGERNKLETKRIRDTGRNPDARAPLLSGISHQFLLVMSASTQ